MSCGGFAAKVWPALISFAYPGLAALDLVEQIMTLVQRMFNNWQKTEEQLLDFVEYCAGRGRLTVELLRRKFHGAAFDKAYTELHDMLSPRGLRLFLDALTSTRRGGLHWWGTKCSSFVSLCQSVAQRYPWNNYLGAVERCFVSEGNEQAEVTAFGMFMSMICGCYPVLEQPLTSVMVLLPSLKSVLSHFNFQKKVVWMGAFQGPSPKPLQISPNCFGFVSSPSPKASGA